jgi:rhodanese-related sulfurtransferase
MTGSQLKRTFHLVAITALLLVLAGCVSAGRETSPTPTAQPVGTVVTTDKGQYRDITPGELNAMMATKDFFHADVHIPNEGKMPRLDARIPFDRITEELDELPADKTAKIVLTCKSGGMSAKAARELADLGYTNVYNLTGGFVAWKDAGYELTPEP